MQKLITVDKAIKRGHLIVNAPAILAMIGCPGLAFYLFTIDLIPNWGIAIGFLIGFILAWLIWSVMITKWRIWAFESVRNVHELKKRAIQEKLIWDDGNIFEKTEIRNEEDKKRLKRLEKKFEIEDEYKEDYTLPPKMEIYYSKIHSYIELGASIFVISIGIYFCLFSENKNYILGGIMTAVGLYGMVKESKKMFNNKKPQIIIDSYGIKTINIGFKSWSTIENEEVYKEGYGKSSKTYLLYVYDDNKFEKIQIDNLNVTMRKMENIIKTYRIRSNKNIR